VSGSEGALGGATGSPLGGADGTALVIEHPPPPVGGLGDTLSSEWSGPHDVRSLGTAKGAIVVGGKGVGLAWIGEVHGDDERDTGGATTSWGQCWPLAGVQWRGHHIAA
jgi:hypothetical protein